MNNHQKETIQHIRQLQGAIERLPRDFVFVLTNRCDCILGFASELFGIPTRYNPISEELPDTMETARHMGLVEYGFCDTTAPFYRGREQPTTTRDEAIMDLELVAICVEEGI